MQQEKATTDKERKMEEEGSGDREHIRRGGSNTEQVRLAGVVGKNVASAKNKYFTNMTGNKVTTISDNCPLIICTSSPGEVRLNKFEYAGGPLTVSPMLEGLGQASVRVVRPCVGRWRALTVRSHVGGGRR